MDLGNDAKPAAQLVKNRPIRAFDGKTALEMIANDRVGDVIAYLQSLSAYCVG